MFPLCRVVGTRSWDEVRNALGVHDYSLRAELPCVEWVRRYILFHGKRHPRNVGMVEVWRHGLLECKTRPFAYNVAASLQRALTSGPQARAPESVGARRGRVPLPPAGVR